MKARLMNQKLRELRGERIERNKTVQELMARYPGISDEKMAERASELERQSVSARQIAMMRRAIQRGEIPPLPYVADLANFATSYRSRPLE